MAIGLLARVDRKISAAHVERLLGHAKRPPISCRAHHPGTGESPDHPFECRVHLAGLDDLVADQAAFRAVAFEPPVVLDRLPRDAVAGEARQAHVGGARNNALLARGQGQERAALGEHVVHHQQELAVAADGKGLDRGDPRLLDAPPAELVGRRVVGAGEPAIDLVDVAEVALEVPEERDAAMIEMGEIDAGAEHATSLVFRMLDDGAAHDRDFARAVEQREIDADLRTVERGLILGVEKAGIVLRHHRGLAGALDRGARELDDAVALELRQQVLRFRPRQQHGMAEMPPAALAAEHRGQKRALVDLEPALVALQYAVLGGDLLLGRDQPRHYPGRADHEILEAHEARAPHRQRVVDGIAMAPEKALARLARALSNDRRRGLLALVAAGLRRELPYEARRLLPIVGEFPSIGGKIGGLARLGLQPFANPGAGKTRRRQTLHRSRIAGARAHGGTPDITQTPPTLLPNTGSARAVMPPCRNTSSGSRARARAAAWRGRAARTPAR